MMPAAVIVSSSKVAAAALAVALFAVLASYAEAAKPGGGWLPAKATWYGAPNGAGPDDNGMHEQSVPGRAPVVFPPSQCQCASV
jgi:hypothetical protein